MSGGGGGLWGGGGEEQKSTLREAVGLKMSLEGSSRDKVTAVESCHTIDQ